MGRMQLAGPPT